MSEKPISPLRRRMIEDMTVRNFVDKTRNDYIRHVRTFTAFLGRSPDTATLRIFAVSSCIRRFDDVTQSPGRFSVRPCVRMRRGGSPYNALSEGCSLGRADPPQEDEAWGTIPRWGRWR